jgi:hypothetical protein
MRFARAMVAAAAGAAAFVFYVELRRKCFPVSTPHELTAAANRGKPALARAFAAALRWYAQPVLPRDPLNNPLVDASTPYRVAGAFRVFVRGLGQLLIPRTLSGDYSAPAEPIPSRLIFPESVAGAAAMVLPLLACPLLAMRATVRGGTQAIVGFAMAWIVISYFPVSNIPVVLPTVRAERFWYFPAIGSAILLALAFAWMIRAAMRATRPKMYGSIVAAALILLLGCQAFQARRHALDYTNDLVFWNATRKAVPRSAKAHLNYSVMVGARGDLPARLAANTVALTLAPRWPMANVYLGDTLCRMHRSPEALPHYVRGFTLGPNDLGLIALGLQCLWDEHQLLPDAPARTELQTLADDHPGSWLKYLVDDTFENGEQYSGVNPKYRPRGYNEGPKKDD